MPHFSEQSRFYIGDQNFQYGLNNYIEYTSYCNSAEIPSIENSSLQITVSPNPFSTNTTLKSNYIINNVSLKVYDLFGNLVKVIQDLEGQVFILNSNDLHDGMYIIQICQGNEIIENKRVIIRR